MSEQPMFDFTRDPHDTEARLQLVSEDRWSKDPQFGEFVAALRKARKGSLSLIYPDDVRAQYLEETLDGPRISIPPQRYSAFWRRAATEGLIRNHEVDGVVQAVRSENSPTGNNSRLTPVRRWVGGQ